MFLNITLVLHMTSIPQYLILTPPTHPPQISLVTHQQIFIESYEKFNHSNHSYLYTHTHLHTHIYISRCIISLSTFCKFLFYFLFLLLSFFVLNYLNIPSKLVWYLFPNSTLLKGSNTFSHLNRQITTLHI